MSTESGLPDFRSSGGLWKRGRRFEALASVDALAHDYEEQVAFYRWRIEELRRFSPHRGHTLLAEWQRRGLVETLVTQNVDGFHERAGSTPLTLHGSLSEVRCQRCAARRPAATFLSDAGTRCDCGGKMRPGVVLFGEALPAATLDAAVTASRAADLFVVLGSSLLVSPANLLPGMALAAGAKLVIINREPTPYDPRAHLTHDGAIGPALEAVERHLTAPVNSGRSS